MYVRQFDDDSDDRDIIITPTTTTTTIEQHKVIKVETLSHRRRNNNDDNDDDGDVDNETECGREGYEQRECMNDFDISNMNDIIELIRTDPEFIGEVTVSIQMAAFAACKTGNLQTLLLMHTLPKSALAIHFQCLIDLCRTALGFDHYDIASYLIEILKTLPANQQSPIIKKSFECCVSAIQRNQPHIACYLIEQYQVKRPRNYDPQKLMLAAIKSQNVNVVKCVQSLGIMPETETINGLCEELLPNLLWLIETRKFYHHLLWFIQSRTFDHQYCSFLKFISDKTYQKIYIDHCLLLLPEDQLCPKHIPEDQLTDFNRPNKYNLTALMNKSNHTLEFPNDLKTEYPYFPWKILKNQTKLCQPYHAFRARKQMITQIIIRPMYSIRGVMDMYVIACLSFE